MRIDDFKRKLSTKGIAKNNRAWYPRWVQRFGACLPQGKKDGGFTTDDVIGFLRGLLQKGTLAWQRLQAVDAICAYRDMVLEQGEPDLQSVRVKLIEIAARERRTGVPNGVGAEAEDDRKRLVGNLDCDEPVLIQQTRAKLRVMHYSLETERAYVTAKEKKTGSPCCLRIAWKD